MRMSYIVEAPSILLASLFETTLLSFQELSLNYKVLPKNKKRVFGRVTVAMSNKAN